MMEWIKVAQKIAAVSGWPLFLKWPDVKDVLYVDRSASSWNRVRPGMQMSLVVWWN